MNTITIQDIKRNGSKVLPKDQETYLIVNSNIDHVIVPHDWYQVLVKALEELEDIKAIEDFEDNPEIVDYNEAINQIEQGGKD